MNEIIQADLTWIDGGFVPDVRVGIADGVISAVGGDLPAPTRRLEGRALLPGMISAHSHAFQRGLRGRGERFPSGAGSFWTWREAMYSLVESVDRDRFLELCTATFSEMLAAGITSLGEFHYFHHSAAALQDRCDWKFDELVLEAARETGIRIVLLQTFYRDGGIGKPPAAPQKRFYCASPSEFWRQLDRLSTKLGPRQTLGVVAHSIRAVDPETIAELHTGAKSRNLPFHMHIEEQRQEIAECIAAYGATPSRLLLDRLDIGSEFTSVHATHTSPVDLTELLQRGANVCIAPLTEANLADGFPARAPLHDAPAQISLGTDSNARISMLEEMRMLEYAHRLREERRGIWIDEDGNAASTLFRYATTGGARSLGLHAGSIRTGMLADLITLDLADPSLRWSDPDTLLDSWIFGASDRAIRDVCVGGEWVVGGQKLKS